MTYYYTYRITCTHPESVERYYYGFRKSSVHPSLDQYWSSSKYVKEAISKYGKDAFKKKIIAIFRSAQDAIQHESQLHEKFKVDKHPKFFNRCRSTIWGFRSTGIFLSGKTYEDIHGEEKAKTLKAERSKSMKQYRNEHPDSMFGQNNPNYGNKWSDEKRKAFANSRQKENHPAYGLVWINNGESSRKIRNTEQIPDGWVRGRIRTWQNQYGK
jgi:hypothetical protein